MTAREQIEAYTGGPLGPGLASLEDADLAALATTIREAATAQDAALAEAVEQGLQIVPRVLRGTVRKALFG